MRKEEYHIKIYLDNKIIYGYFLATRGILQGIQLTSQPGTLINQDFFLLSNPIEKYGATKVATDLKILSKIPRARQAVKKYLVLG